ncbi:MAG: pyridoxine 5'-phosphate synthase [Pseudobdellovibrio sp.]
MGKIRLGVNIDHAATLRQVRGGTTSYPDLLELCKESQKGGARQITIHLREDRRHIQDHDVVTLTRRSPLEINLEMGATDEMVKIAKKYKPSWVCLVPEKRQELTTEGGLDIVSHFNRLEKITHELHQSKIKVSFFIEPSLDQVEASALCGADAVELHTGSWVMLKGLQKKKEWSRLAIAAQEINRLGLRVHAGHGLDYKHCQLIRKLPFLVEVNVGHSLICYSLRDGLKASVKKMIQVLNQK